MARFRTKRAQPNISVFYCNPNVKFIDSAMQAIKIKLFLILSASDDSEYLIAFSKLQICIEAKELQESEQMAGMLTRSYQKVFCGYDKVIAQSKIEKCRPLKVIIRPTTYTDTCGFTTSVVALVALRERNFAREKKCDVAKHNRNL